MHERLGELLVRKGLISPKQLEETLKAQMIYGARLGTNLVELGLLRLEDLGQLLAEQRRCQLATTEELDGATKAALELLTPERALKYLAFPFAVEGRRVKLAMASPWDPEATSAIAFITGLRVVPYVLPELRLFFYLERHYGIERAQRYIRLAPEHPSGTPAPKAPPPASPQDSVKAQIFGRLGENEQLSAADDELSSPQAAWDGPTTAPPVQPPQTPTATVAPPPVLPPADDGMGIDLPGVAVPSPARPSDPASVEAGATQAVAAREEIAASILPGEPVPSAVAEPAEKTQPPEENLPILPVLELSPSDQAPLPIPIPEEPPPAVGDGVDTAGTVQLAQAWEFVQWSQPPAEALPMADPEQAGSMEPISIWDQLADVAVAAGPDKAALESIASAGSAALAVEKALTLIASSARRVFFLVEFLGEAKVWRSAGPDADAPAVWALRVDLSSVSALTDAAIKMTALEATSCGEDPDVALFGALAPGGKAWVAPVVLHGRCIGFLLADEPKPVPAVLEVVRQAAEALSEGLQRLG
ncbi:MAG: hypothetical protein ACOZIN_00110 [Myxococcota bacterium]